MTIEEMQTIADRINDTIKKYYELSDHERELVEYVYRTEDMIDFIALVNLVYHEDYQFYVSKRQLGETLFVEMGLEIAFDDKLNGFVFTDEICRFIRRDGIDYVGLAENHMEETCNDIIWTTTGNGTVVGIERNLVQMN